MEGALERSVNTVSVKILNEVGIGETIALAHQMGISSTIPEVPSIALGTPSISVQEMVTAYCSFVNGGLAVAPYTIERIEDKSGKVLYEHKTKVYQQAISPKTSRMMASLLEGVVDDGTARSLRTVYKLNNRMGGKTGTTQNNADGWFMAITPQLVTGTWVGGMYPEISFQDTRLGQGATMALPIFASFYSKLNKNSDYNYITKANFLPIKEAWRDELDCDPFKEDFRLFDWLFGARDKETKIDQASENIKDKGLLKKIGNIFKKKEKEAKDN
jgi:penicillin-binding protein 1A